MKNFIFLIILLCFASCQKSITIIEGDGGSSNSNPTRSENSNNNGPTNVDVNSYEKEIHKLVNEHRNKLGKNTLQWHDFATVESQDHSQDMASFKVPFGHIGFSDRVARIKAKDNDTILASGENVAQNSSAKRAFNAWLGSPGHRKNIEGNWTHSGIGARKSANGSWYFTQIFLRK